ncbi:unnamed protein product [Ectocarpus sp. CCAP 1310/34]|nr:unnamed protein product [Ectocarpus sp. CCAP 1310/34]
MVNIEEMRGGEEGHTSGDWESELGSQRDVALAMARQLSQQLDSQRETLEGRATTAEALRDFSRQKCSECLESHTRRDQAAEVPARLAGLVGGSLSAWLFCVALGLTWAPRVALALGIPCTLVMAALCSKRMPWPSVKRRSD